MPTPYHGPEEVKSLFRKKVLHLVQGQLKANTGSLHFSIYTGIPIGVVI